MILHLKLVGHLPSLLFPDSTPLVDVIVKLMRKTGMRVDKQRWQKQLSKVVVKHNVSLAIELENQGFYALQITKKLHIFKVTNFLL